MKSLGLAGCAQQQCWADETEAYSVNELAINWNAPLAWVAAWLDEAAQRKNQTKAERGLKAVDEAGRGGAPTRAAGTRSRRCRARPR